MDKEKYINPNMILEKMVKKDQNVIIQEINSSQKNY